LNRFFYSVALFFLSLVILKGQAGEIDKYIQVSGIITDESYRPVQGVAVISRKLHRGSLSEKSGIYTITSTPGDTIFFRALGFKRYHTIIPASYEDKNCLVDIILALDTIPIEEITIFPWKNYTEFIQDMTREHPVNPIIENMNDNIASIYVAVSNQIGLRISPEAGYRYAMEQNFTQMATRNQIPVNNLFNPFAWAKFIHEIKNGLFKNQKFNKPVNAKVRKKKRSSDDQ
jgi:hypothetical protein